ncbi:nucleolin-like [Homalodisca vitripennis]|uniref:nucleolin-like n=1 Tax=Homalodisca vitripennis TaxID=197043 RepID=UPI001EEC8E14|nr:nucleolin-like [Homalodisca vitripennis]
MHRDYSATKVIQSMFKRNSSEREDKVSAETNISPEGYKRRQESKASSTRAKSSVGAERPQGGIYVIVHRIIQSKRKEDPYGNEVESKKRKTTKRAPKKGRGKKLTVAATVGDGGGKPDEEKEEDCDESIDIEESDVYIKQEALEPEIIDDIKPPVITVSSLNSCEPETIVPEIIPVVIKTEPMEEEEETTSAAVDDTSKDDEESKGWKCTSLGCHRIFRNKDKMELHAKRKHALDDKVNGGNLVTIKEEDQNSTFGLLSLETFPTPVVSTNAR